MPTLLFQHPRTTAAEELVDAFRDANDSGVPLAHLRMLAALEEFRGAPIPLRRLADSEGVSGRTLRRRRHRTLQAIRAAVLEQEAA